MLRLLHPRPLTRRKDATGSTAVAQTLRDAMVSGQLRPGERLPSTRELAVQCGVHRHTVSVAFALLVAEGWLEVRARKGAYACDPLPDVYAEAAPSIDAAHAPGFAPRFARVPSGAWSLEPRGVRHRFHAAIADVRLLPREELRAAYGEVLRRAPAWMLEGEDPRGLSRLRGALSSYLRRARAIEGRELVITHGSQDAIFSLAQLLLAPGDRVLVEDPGYPPAWEVFRAAGAEVVPIPVDSQGMDTQALRRALLHERVRVVYTTPLRHYPTTVGLAPERRAQLLRYTAERGVLVLEDDYDHEFHYRASPPPPLAAQPAAHHVVYVATFSKLVAPWVRIGCIAAGPGVTEALARWRSAVSRGSDTVAQAALATWIEGGGLARHLRRARRAYEERRDAMINSLSGLAKDGHPLRFGVPDGGLSVWVETLGLDSVAIAHAAYRAGILVLPEALVRVEPGRHSGLRLAFGRHTPEEIRVGMARLGRVLAVGGFGV